MTSASAPILRAILAALALVPALGVAAPPTVGGCQVLPADNYWNTPVDNLPVHWLSPTWVGTIGTASHLHADWGNVLADNFGIPFATVTGAQPLVPIQNYTDVPLPFTDLGGDFSDESDPGPYPIPPTAPVEGGAGSGGDMHVLVLETTNCVLYELYFANYVGDPQNSWVASSFAKWPLNSNALRPTGWTSADAAGLPIFPGLVRYDEASSGEITHAIRFTAKLIWGRTRPPATRSTCGPAATPRATTRRSRARPWARASASRRATTSPPRSIRSRRRSCAR